MALPMVLIDGSSYFFRAFYALPPLQTSQGQPTGAIYGVANMVKRLLKDYNPKQIAVVFDAKGKTFRDEWYPQYKAHRTAMPDELSGQFTLLVDLLEAMGLPIVTIPGVEADDVIGTLATLASAQGIPVLISTSDKDMAQLVDERITLINTMSNQILNPDGVYQKFGVTPAQMIDYLTLIGDAVDNIPGVPKCGPKTAVKWLGEYNSLDNLLANAEKISGKIGEYLRASIEHIPLSKKLITIKTDLALPFDLPALTLKEANREQLIALTRTFEFKAWLKELLSTETAAPHQWNSAIPVIHTREQLQDLVAQLSQATSICVHLETSCNDMFTAEILSIGCGSAKQQESYIPLRAEQLTAEVVLTALKPILINPNINKIGHNIKRIDNILSKYEIKLQGKLFDVMLESYVLNSSANTHDRDSLALKYLGLKPITYEEIAGKGAKQLTFDKIALQPAATYVSDATQTTLKLHHKLYGMLEAPLKKILEEIELPLLGVLAKMERTGVLIDAAILIEQGKRLKLRMEQLAHESKELAGREFNVNSPKQLQEILFEELKLPVISRTPTGQPSTSEAILQELAYDYRLPAVILEYRSISKLVSTYIDALPKCIHPLTQRVHTCYNQAVTATGRLSSSEPNLQNIPIRSEEGRMIRRAFIAPPGHLLVTADYSQIELRIMAHLSQDANLLHAFNMGWDIHTATASEIFQVQLTQVTKEQRRRSKAINFGLIYGMSAFGLAKQLGIERQDAQYYIDSYFKRYPGVLDYMEKTRQQAHQLGYVETLFGRRLYLPEINTTNFMRQKAAERMAINAPMQGSAADIIKKAMLVIDAWQEDVNPYVKMIMQVHDELVFEVHKDYVATSTQQIRDLMEQAANLSIPLEVSIGVGHNWDEAH